MFFKLVFDFGGIWKPAYMVYSFIHVHNLFILALFVFIYLSFVVNLLLNSIFVCVYNNFGVGSYSCDYLTEVCEVIIFGGSLRLRDKCDDKHGFFHIRKQIFFKWISCNRCAIHRATWESVFRWMFWQTNNR